MITRERDQETKTAECTGRVKRLAAYERALESAARREAESASATTPDSAAKPSTATPPIRGPLPPAKASERVLRPPTVDAPGYSAGVPRTGSQIPSKQVREKVARLWLTGGSPQAVRELVAHCELLFSGGGAKPETRSHWESCFRDAVDLVDAEAIETLLAKTGRPSVKKKAHFLSVGLSDLLVQARAKKRPKTKAPASLPRKEAR